jgi:hypothetical protein
MSTDRQAESTKGGNADRTNFLPSLDRARASRRSGAPFRVPLVRGGQHSGYDIDGVRYADGRTQLLDARSGRFGAPAGAEINL